MEPWKLNLFSVSSLACCLSCLLLSLFGALQRSNSIQRLFVAFNVFVSIWGLGCFIAGVSRDAESARYGWMIAISGGVFISTSFYHLIHQFCRLKHNIVLSFSYAQAFFFLLCSLFVPELLYSRITPLFGVHYLQVTPLLTCTITLFVVIVIISFSELLAFLRASSGRQKQQAGYIAFGFFFGFFGGISVLLPKFGVTVLYPVGNIGICFYALVLAYAIFKHHILDIRVVIRKTLLYFMLAAFISSTYVLVVFVFRAFFIGEEPLGRFLLNNLLLILTIALLLKPLEIQVQRLLDRRFFLGSIDEIFAEKMQLESELARRERLKSVGILAAGMAHEIKNPLATLQTFTEYLPHKYDDPEFRAKFTRIVAQEVSRMKGLVADLLAFSKPAEPQRTSFRLDELVRNLADLVSTDVLKAGIRVDLELEAAAAHADQLQIKQALLNLLLNAIEAMRSTGGALSVAVTQKGDDASVSVRDTGPGIAADVLPHIFDPFFTSKDEGTGLGLAITHSIIEKNSGSITVSSRAGEGAEFVVRLPAAPKSH